MTAAAVSPGFADPVVQSQAAFRGLLDAMARPGQVVEIGELNLRAGTLSTAAAAVALTLADFETPVWLSSRLADAVQWLRFHCGCPVIEAPGNARFAFITWKDVMPTLSSFDLGSDEYPDRSTTLVIEVSALEAESGLKLSGPGIREVASLRADGLEPHFWSEREMLVELFPRGLDIVLTSGARLAALPRTTRVEV
jgi:alpha-D-ribose 1-methylphosphonate 5-triphosphate synthase subunit PhnH